MALAGGCQRVIASAAAAQADHGDHLLQAAPPLAMALGSGKILEKEGPKSLNIVGKTVRTRPKSGEIR